VARSATSPAAWRRTPGRQAARLTRHLPGVHLAFAALDQQLIFGGGPLACGLGTTLPGAASLSQRRFSDDPRAARGGGARSGLDAAPSAGERLRAAVVVGLLPLYVKHHSHGDFIYDWSWAAAYRQLGRPYYPKLMSWSAHTPVAGARLLVAEGPQAPRIRQTLVEAAKALVSRCAASSWHVALATDAEASRLREAGLLISRDVQFHWLDSGCGDFDGYLATFSCRQAAQGARRTAAGGGQRAGDRDAPRRSRSTPPNGRCCTGSTPALSRAFNNHAAFSAACFADLALALGRRMVLFIARERRLPVAVAICFRSDEALYGRYWGCSGNYPSLHFELCFYQGIAYCLRRGCAASSPAPAANTSSRAASRRPSCSRRTGSPIPAMRALLARHLAQQGDAVAIPRRGRQPTCRSGARLAGAGKTDRRAQLRPSAGKPQRPALPVPSRRQRLDRIAVAIDQRRRPAVVRAVEQQEAVAVEDDAAAGGDAIVAPPSGLSPLLAAGNGLS
jgi:predicted N-acyltransferase